MVQFSTPMLQALGMNSNSFVDNPTVWEQYNPKSLKKSLGTCLKNNRAANANNQSEFKKERRKCWKEALINAAEKIAVAILVAIIV